MSGAELAARFDLPNRENTTHEVHSLKVRMDVLVVNGEFAVAPFNDTLKVVCPRLGQFLHSPEEDFSQESPRVQTGNDVFVLREISFKKGDTCIISIGKDAYRITHLGAEKSRSALQIESTRSMIDSLVFFPSYGIDLTQFMKQQAIERAARMRGIHNLPNMNLG